MTIVKLRVVMENRVLMLQRDFDELVFFVNIGAMVKRGEAYCAKGEWKEKDADVGE